jgi:hypothetical protein
MKNSTFAFITLCIAAPTVQLLEHYGLFHWKDDVVFPLLLIGICLFLALFVWSIFIARHQPVRGVAGELICAYCIWQAFQNGKMLY